MRRGLFGLIVALLSTFLWPISARSAENCPVFDFNKVFYFGYSSDFPKWNTPGAKRIITWTTLDSGELNGKKIQKSFDAQTKSWLREAFQSWDDALDSISFQESNSSEAVDIRIGWTQVLHLDYESLFTVKMSNGIRSEATMEFKSQSTFLIFRDNFIQAAQSDIGHILGMGYISPSPEIVSVMEWPFQAPYRQLPLGKFDVGLIRAIYSESTCPSTFNPVIQARIRELEEAEIMVKQEAELKVKQEAELRARQEADARAAEELRAKQEADAKALAEKIMSDAKAEAVEILTAAKAAVIKESTIICVKGKKAKKITAVKPKCPKGFKKK